ncbi:hypothetical protein CAPTEDRAFT_192765 [Capitella teleta]|uniref:Integrase core domain-containing protein n=1 Tax=Capitella teleta TaxID=283909 RepID=R7VKX7_CAPTE|nr:hypothetical protein CAPTEDRAFT_192765 [Capitella teleta]|eukprot:ELU17761.1 hypothetical protein CAPTEDRAFT_192765 [Capitella teleta]
MQIQLNRRGRQAPPPFITGPSTSNQRIESFWSQMRKQSTDYWICLFSAIEETGDYTGDFVDKHISQFCFMGLIQDELDNVLQVWNDHKIRASSVVFQVEGLE